MRAGGKWSSKSQVQHVQKLKRYTFVLCLVLAGANGNTCGRKLRGDEKQLIDLEWPNTVPLGANFFPSCIFVVSNVSYRAIVTTQLLLGLELIIDRVLQKNNTVEPPNSGHIGGGSPVRCREVVPISEVG